MSTVARKLLVIDCRTGVVRRYIDRRWVDLAKIPDFAFGVSAKSRALLALFRSNGTPASGSGAV